MLARKITEATSEANAKLADLQSDLSSVISENERQASTIEEQNEEMARLRAQVQTQSGQIEQLKNDASSIREQLTSKIKSSESAQIALGKADRSIEYIPELTAYMKPARTKAKRQDKQDTE